MWNLASYAFWVICVCTQYFRNITLISVFLMDISEKTQNTRQNN